MHEVVEIVRNDGSADCVVVIEPWGMPLRLSPGRAFKVVARSPSAGELEVVRRPDQVIVYLWPGATATVFDADRLVYEFDTPVPGVPPGKSVRQFLDLMGFRPPPSGG